MNYLFEHFYTKQGLMYGADQKAQAKFFYEEGYMAGLTAMSQTVRRALTEKLSDTLKGETK